MRPHSRWCRRSAYVQGHFGPNGRTVDGPTATIEASDIRGIAVQIVRHVRSWHLANAALIGLRLARADPVGDDVAAQGKLTFFDDLLRRFLG
jgi:hypothetical protein